MDSPSPNDGAPRLDIRTRMRLERWVALALMLAAGVAMAGVLLAAQLQLLQRLGIGTGP